MFSLPFLFPNEDATTKSNSTKKSATAITNKVAADIDTQHQELDPKQGVEVFKYYISEDESSSASSSDNSSVMSYENEEGSDESDSRFMSEQGEMSFMALHHHQRVHVDSNTGFLSPLKNDDRSLDRGKIAVDGTESRNIGPISPLDLTLQVNTVTSDEASLISSIGAGDFLENGAMSDASTSVELNPYENGVSSPKMSAATRWRRNKNISDLERKNKRGRAKKDAIASKTSLTRQHISSKNNSAVRSSHDGSRNVGPKEPEKYYSPRLPPPPPPPLMTKKYSGSQFQISPEQSRASGKSALSFRGSKPLLSGSMSAATIIQEKPKLRSAVVNKTDEYVSFGDKVGGDSSTALSMEASNANENNPEYRLILGSESPSRSRPRVRTSTLSIGSSHPHEPNPLKQFIPMRTSALTKATAVSLSPDRCAHNITSRSRSTSSQVSRSTTRPGVTSFSCIDNVEYNNSPACSQVNNTRSRENDLEGIDSVPVITPSPLSTTTNARRGVAPREENSSEKKDSNCHFFTCESPSSGSKARLGKSMFLDRLSEMKQSPPSKSVKSNSIDQSYPYTTKEQNSRLQSNAATLSPPSILKNPIHRQRKKEWMNQMWCPENEEWDRLDLSLDDVRRQINFSTSRDQQVPIGKSVTKNARNSTNEMEPLTDDDDSLDDILNSQGPPISDATSEVFSPSVVGDDCSSSLSALKMSRSKNSTPSEEHGKTSTSEKMGDWDAFGEDWTFSSTGGCISNSGSISINASFDDEWLQTNNPKVTKSTNVINARRNKKKNFNVEKKVPFVRKPKIQSLINQISQGQQESKLMTRHSGNNKAATIIQSIFRGRICRNRLIEKLGVAKRKKWESKGSRSARVTKIHSNIRRSARNRLRTRHAMNGTDIYLASMVVSIRHICASTIQKWWKISKKNLGERRAMGFDSSAFPTAWTENKTSYDMFPDLFSDIILDKYSGTSQKYHRPNSRESTTPTSDTSTSRSENFDLEYYQKPQANVHDDEVDANLDMDDEAFVSQVSLLTKMQNGFVGRVLKIFKRQPITRKNYGDTDESKPKKKKKKIRLRAFRKDKRKIKETALEPVMIGDSRANEALPDPNSLYQPLEEDIEEEMAFRRLLAPQRENRSQNNDFRSDNVDTLQFSPSGTRMEKSEDGLLAKQGPKTNTNVHIKSRRTPLSGSESDIVFDDLEVDSNAVISKMMGSAECGNSLWDVKDSSEENNCIKVTRTFESIPFDEI